MPCYHPLKAYRSLERNPETGRYGITFNATKALIEGSSVQLPCGRCVGCRLERSRQWGLRMMHEAQLHASNSFITLTFADEYLPEDYSVRVRDTQLFMKKLRASQGSKSIRFYACGEYGDDNLRPHYHLILFNHDWPDRKLYSKKNGQYLFTSEKLTNLWGYGHATTGDVTFESACYVARYCMKKITGENAGVNYLRQHSVTKMWHTVQPEFGVMSRRPGLGAPWLERYRSDVWPSDYIISRGMKMKPPRFYEQSLTEEELTSIKRQRASAKFKARADNTPERLRVREQVKLAKLSLLKRSV